MSKVIKKVAIGIAAVAMISTGIGAALGGTMMFTAFGASIAASTIAAVAGAVATVAGLFAKAPKVSEASISRLRASLDANAPRKMVLGYTAMPVDIRYYEGSGEDEEYVHYVIAVAAHKVGSIDEIWFEDALAWSLAGGVQGDYVGYMDGVTIRTEGTVANFVTINGGSRWGSDDTLTGCAYIVFRLKRTGNSDEEQSPVASGIPSRVTIIGEGMPLYDPRFDTTVPGGEGTQRADDQSTWGTEAGSRDNLAIHALNVMLGWRINGKLSVGGGIPKEFIDLESYITAANICDESIALSAGGTQPRYHGAGAFSTADPPMTIVNAIVAGCAGTVVDSYGKLSLIIKANTLALSEVELSEDDIMGPVQWDPMGGTENEPNVVAGSFTDPSDNSLYQMVPYPSVSLSSPDGIERTFPLDLSVVQNSAHAERIAKQTLQRMQYPGLFTAPFNLKALAATVGKIVHVDFWPRGWVAKPFRVEKQVPSRSGIIELTLREEHESIYSWAAEDSAPVQPASPVGFNPLNSAPLLLAREAASGVLTNAAQGEWSSAGLSIVRGQIWTRDGSSYIALVTHTSDGTNGPPGANWQVLAEKGEDGAGGGEVFREVFVYKRTGAIATPPATPTGGSYNFDTQVITPPTGWFLLENIPVGDPFVAISAALANSVDGTGTDSSLSWSSPNIVFSEGGTVELIYIKSETQPATPSASSTVPAGWSDDPSTAPGTGSLWASAGPRSSLDLTLIWGTPYKAGGTANFGGAGPNLLPAKYRLFTQEDFPTFVLANLTKSTTGIDNPYLPGTDAYRATLTVGTLTATFWLVSESGGWNIPLKGDRIYLFYGHFRNTTGTKWRLRADYSGGSIQTGSYHTNEQEDVLVVDTTGHGDQLWRMRVEITTVDGTNFVASQYVWPFAFGVFEKIGDLEIVPTVDAADYINNIILSTVEYDADETVSIVGQSTTQIRRDSDLDVKTNELPRQIQMKLIASTGGDVTAQASWSVSDPVAWTASIGAATGLYTITDPADVPGFAEISALYEGKSYGPFKVELQFVDDPPTAVGGTQVQDNSIAPVTTNETYIQISDTLAIVPNGTAIGWSYQVSYYNSTGFSAQQCKVEYRLAGGTWFAATGSETEGDVALINEPGAVSDVGSQGSLTTGAAYEFRLMGRRTDSSGTGTPGGSGSLGINSGYFKVSS